MAAASAEKTPYEHQGATKVSVQYQPPKRRRRERDDGSTDVRSQQHKQTPRTTETTRYGYSDSRQRSQKRTGNANTVHDPNPSHMTVDESRRAESGEDLTGEQILERSRLSRQQGGADESEYEDEEGYESPDGLIYEDQPQTPVTEIIEEEEYFPDAVGGRIRIKKRVRKDTSPLVKAKVTQVSAVIALTATPFWFAQVWLVFVGLIGLGIAGLVGMNISILDGIAGAESFMDVLGALAFGLVSKLLNAISGLFGWVFGTSIQDLGLGIYLATTLIIFIIGAASLFYAWFMYVLRGIDPMRGGGTAALFFAAGLYLVPLIQLFPWVLMFVFAVWWAHR